MLLGRWLDTEFEAKHLADISVETFNNIKQQMLDIFEGCELTDADIKAAWKEWFGWATYGGCLVSPCLNIQTADRRHQQLEVLELVLKLSSEAIDALPTEDRQYNIAAEEERMLAEAEAVKQLLTTCCTDAGATITITVAHHSGQIATANLYDLAALVQSLFEALEYFQSEL